MRFDIHLEREIAPDCADYRVVVTQGDDRVAAFYAQRVNPTKGYLSLLQQIADLAPKCCNDFDVTHRRWNKNGTPYTRRISEWKAYCPHHIGIGFPAYHVRDRDRMPPPSLGFHGHAEWAKSEWAKDRMFECSYCGCVFPEHEGIETDGR